jgi:hypothetical protein
MLSSIDFDDEFLAHANKIGDERANRMLPPKLTPKDLPISQTLPQQFFGVGLILPQTPCPLCYFLPTHCLATPPSGDIL